MKNDYIGRVCARGYFEFDFREARRQWRRRNLAHSKLALYTTHLLRYYPYAEKGSSKRNFIIFVY